MTVRRSATAALLVCAALVRPVPGQQLAVLRGSVLNDATDAPIPAAEVAIPSLGIAATTDSTGAFRLPGVRAGRQIVWVRRLGFSPLSAMLTFTAGDTLERDFMLAVNAQPLPQVDVKAPAHLGPKLSEFEERRKEGFGHFITPEMIVKHENRQLSEIMSLISGPTVVRGTTNAAWIASRRGVQTPFQAGAQALTAFDRAKGAKSGVCYSAVVLDGVYVYQGLPGESLWDINSLQTTELAGIEYYSGGSTMPVKYNGTRNTCGLVVIWTK
jgi:hypothetical protein